MADPYAEPQPSVSQGYQRTKVITLLQTHRHVARSLSKKKFFARVHTALLMDLFSMPLLDSCLGPALRATAPLYDLCLYNQCKPACWSTTMLLGLWPLATAKQLNVTASSLDTTMSLVFHVIVPRATFSLPLNSLSLL
eukprot:SM000147S01108  [mRNA]  locus=s147:64672:65334:- [translate_table: standard]